MTASRLRSISIPISIITIILSILDLTNSSFSSHGRYPLIRKQKLSVKRANRRRLSLLMDSFVDPVISDDYFYAVLYVGSPVSQRVEMALDTGSGLPYFACLSTCTHCGNHDDTPYVLENSTSFEWVSCKHKLCGGGKCKNKDSQNICEWTQKYVDKSSISAVVGSDLISFYKYPYLPLQYYQINRDSSHKAVLVPPLTNEKKLRLTFGCSEHEANTIYRQGADGVMGLSMHHRSFVDQLFNTNNAQNGIDLGNKQFAHCFGAETGGILLFGSLEIDDLLDKFDIKPIWTPFITSQSGHGWYRVKTVGFTVKSAHTQTTNEISVNYASNINAGYHGSVIDTGSSTLSMPRKPSQEIMSAVLKVIHAQTNDKFEWTKDITKNYDFFLQWNGKKIFTDNEWREFNDKFGALFPDILMLWSGDSDSDKPLEFSIPMQRYLLFKKPHICLDLFGDTPSILVGSNVMIDKFMVYDRERMRLGVANINCDTLLRKEKSAETVVEQSVETVQTLTPAPTVTVTEKKIENFERENIGNTPTKRPIFVENNIAPIYIMPSTNYYEMYWKYVLIVIVSCVCIVFAYNKCKKDSNAFVNGNNNNGRNNMRYTAVNTVDPDFEDMDSRRKIHNYQRKKNANNHHSTSNNNNSSLSSINMDNVLSMTTPTQSFTSKQLEGHHHNINSNNDTAI